MVTRLAALFRRTRPHVVHSHNWPTYVYTAMAARLARTRGWIHGEHGYEDERSIDHRLGTKRLLARGAARFTTVSRHLEQVLIERWRVAPERIRRVPNGVDLARFDPGKDSIRVREALGIASGSQVVMSIGRFGAVKDFPTLIRGFARVRSSRPAVRLVLVGAGETGALEQVARELGVADSVIFAGPRADVPELLGFCDLYINSSRFEGMSNTILEAMAMGRPVIATAVGGNTELVREGETGFLVPPADPVRLGETMERLLSEPELARRMGERGRSIIEGEHALRGMVEAYEGLYLEVGRGSARREPPHARTATGPK